MSTAAISPSSPSNHEGHIPTATLALPSIATSSASRRLPPPCWSHDETVALIDAYRDKWYSLRRGNLRSQHWQEVADDVAARCPVSPAKTAVQCRHKMEKLRKRYRAEIQRAAPYGGPRRFCSSWVHFDRMHSMEKGPNPSPPSSDDEEQDEDQKNSVKRINDIYNLYTNQQKSSYNNQGQASNGTAAPAVRIRIPGRTPAGPTAAKIYSKFDELGGQNPINPNPGFNSSAYGTSSKVLRDGFMGRGEMGKTVIDNAKKAKAGTGIDDMVAAIRSLGEGFVRMEKVKMDMAREVEEMRMEMELKRTEMILESQQRIVDAFSRAMSERKVKKVKRMSTPEC